MEEKLKEILEDEQYDIFEEFSVSEISKMIENLTKNLGALDSDDVLRIGETQESKLGKYTFRLRNYRGGFVSCSDSNQTGFSSTLYYPYFYDSEDPLAGLENLVEMINEAWYLCNN